MIGPATCATKLPDTPGLLKLPTDKAVHCLPGDDDGAMDTAAKAEAACLKMLSSVARRRGDTLVLDLDKGVQRKFEDKDVASSDCNGDCLTYRLVGLLPQSRYYLVREFELERTNDLLVPMGSDYLMQSLDAPIHFSPSGQIAVAVAGRTLVSRETDIEVLKFFNEGSQAVFSFYNREPWEFVAIVNDGEVKLRVGEGEVETQHYEAILKKDAFDVWHLTKTKSLKSPPADKPRQQ